MKNTGREHLQGTRLDFESSSEPTLKHPTGITLKVFMCSSTITRCEPEGDIREKKRHVLYPPISDFVGFRDQQQRNTHGAHPARSQCHLNFSRIRYASTSHIAAIHYFGKHLFTKLPADKTSFSRRQAAQRTPQTQPEALAGG